MLNTPITENYKITRLVFAGCGAKVSSYAGVYKALYELGLMHEVREIAGVSSGGFMAACIAVGISPQQIFNDMLTLDFKENLGQPNINIYGLLQLEYDGLALRSFIRKSLVTTILDFLSTYENKYHGLHEIQSKLQKSDASFTFRDLKILREHNPETFKDLTLTAVSHPSGELKIFNYTLTPDVEIALACHASCAIPMLFAPVEIQGNLYFDGGVYNPITTDYFDFDGETPLENQKKSETLVFAVTVFVEEQKDDIFKALYGAPENYLLLKEQERGVSNPPSIFYRLSFFQRYQRDNLPRHYCGFSPSYSHVNETAKAYARLHENYPLRTLHLYAGHIKAFSFKEAKDYSRTLAANGYITMMHFAFNHCLLPNSRDNNLRYLKFYDTVVNYFDILFNALYYINPKKFNEDSLFIKLMQVKAALNNRFDDNSLTMLLEKFQIIKEHTDKDFKSWAAFALTRAIELENSLISKEQLIREIDIESQKYNITANCMSNNAQIANDISSIIQDEIDSYNEQSLLVELSEADNAKFFR